jgi:hypothetical protein
LELGRVQPAAGLQADGLAAGVDPAAAYGLLEFGEAVAQGAAGEALVGFGPEEGGQEVARMRYGRDGEVDEQGQGLTRADLDSDTIQLDARWTKQVET